MTDQAKLAELVISINQDRAKLLACLSGILSIAVIARNKEIADLIQNCLSSLENKTLKDFDINV